MRYYEEQGLLASARSLTGTTIRAVRHYHQIGLLDEPERRANGTDTTSRGEVHLEVSTRRARPGYWPGTRLPDP